MVKSIHKEGRHRAHICNSNTCEEMTEPMVQGQSVTNRGFQGYPGLHKTLFQVKNQQNQTKEQYIKTE